MAETDTENVDRAEIPSHQQAALRQRALRMNANNNNASINNGNDADAPVALANLNIRGNRHSDSFWQIQPDMRADNEDSPPDEGSDYLADNSNLSGWSEAEVVGGTPPSSRSLHAGAILNDVFYCFGGYNGVARVNTFHAYSFVEKRWSPVLPSANSAGPPTSRDRHVAIAFGNTFYIHGGFDGTSRVGDFWLFDFSSLSWSEVLVLGGTAPSPRHSHSAVVHGHCLYIFGGYDGSYKSDLHEFDFISGEWNLVHTTGRRPRARYRATTVAHKNYIILMGGHDGTRHLSDTHIFDIENRSWSPLVTEGSIIPRDSHIAVTHSNYMYVFGGSSGNALNDLYELQLPTDMSLPGKW
mmetsp:Transcript_25564/g.53862  ORF Transcript_25564/g.53862 Transcript_25564/m.53862 type:complete len:354 (-) Transcript_25564:833-1894(-)